MLRRFGLFAILVAAFLPALAQAGDGLHHPGKAVPHGEAVAHEQDLQGPVGPPVRIDLLAGQAGDGCHECAEKQPRQAKVVEILRRERGNKTRAARALGIDRRKIYRLVEKYGIQDTELHEGE